MAKIALTLLEAAHFGFLMVTGAIDVNLSLIGTPSVDIPRFGEEIVTFNIKLTFTFEGQKIAELTRELPVQVTRSRS